MPTCGIKILLPYPSHEPLLGSDESIVLVVLYLLYMYTDQILIITIYNYQEQMGKWRVKKYKFTTRPEAFLELGVVTSLPKIHRHGILHKPSASIKFWPKSFHKNSVIFDIFAKHIVCDFWHIWHNKLCVFVISVHTRSTEYKIHLKPCVMLL